MIIRILVVDPNNSDEVLVYQMPEHSRNAELFLELLDKRKLEYVVIEPKRKVADVAEVMEASTATGTN